MRTQDCGPRPGLFLWRPWAHPCPAGPSAHPAAVQPFVAFLGRSGGDLGTGQSQPWGHWSPRRHGSRSGTRCSEAPREASGHRVHPRSALGHTLPTRSRTGRGSEGAGPLCPGARELGWAVAGPWAGAHRPASGSGHWGLRGAEGAGVRARLAWPAGAAPRAAVPTAPSLPAASPGPCPGSALSPSYAAGSSAPLLSVASPPGAHPCPVERRPGEPAGCPAAGWPVRDPRGTASSLLPACSWGPRPGARGVVLRGTHGVGGRLAGSKDLSFPLNVKYTVTVENMGKQRRQQETVTASQPPRRLLLTAWWIFSGSYIYICGLRIFKLSHTYDMVYVYTTYIRACVRFHQ